MIACGNKGGHGRFAYADNPQRRNPLIIHILAPGPVKRVDIVACFKNHLGINQRGQFQDFRDLAQIVGDIISGLPAMDIRIMHNIIVVFIILDYLDRTRRGYIAG